MAIVTLTKANFEAEAVNSDKPVLIDFWASWCGPCRMLSPVVDEVADERADIKVGKVNVDEEPELASKFGVMSIPTLVVLVGGQVRSQSVGVVPKEKILELL
jgi:thioredoxin 1